LRNIINSLIPGVQQYDEITDEGLALIDKEGNRQIIKADTIIYAVGVKSDKSLAEELEGKVPALYRIGDCLEPRDIEAAIDEGARVGSEV